MKVAICLRGFYAATPEIINGEHDRPAGRKVLDGRKNTSRRIYHNYLSDVFNNHKETLFNTHHEFDVYIHSYKTTEQRDNNLIGKLQEIAPGDVFHNIEEYKHNYMQGRSVFKSHKMVKRPQQYDYIVSIRWDLLLNITLDELLEKSSPDKFTFLHRNGRKPKDIPWRKNTRVNDLMWLYGSKHHENMVKMLAKLKSAGAFHNMWIHYYNRWLFDDDINFILPNWHHGGSGSPIQVLWRNWYNYWYKGIHWSRWQCLANTAKWSPPGLVTPSHPARRR